MVYSGAFVDQARECGLIVATGCDALLGSGVAWLHLWSQRRPEPRRRVRCSIPNPVGSQWSVEIPEVAKAANSELEADQIRMTQAALEGRETRHATKGKRG
jgi:hypothetical protein